jgi:hypothetical protein
LLVLVLVIFIGFVDFCGEKIENKHGNSAEGAIAPDAPDVR